MRVVIAHSTTRSAGARRAPAASLRIQVNAQALTENSSLTQWLGWPVVHATFIPPGAGAPGPMPAALLPRAVDGFAAGVSAAAAGADAGIAAARGCAGGCCARRNGSAWSGVKGLSPGNGS